MADTYLKKMLGDQEDIILVTRQHWFLLVSQIFLELVLMGLIITGVVILVNTVPVVGLFGLLGLILLAIPLISGTIDVMRWYSHKYIVTNLRVIQVSGVINKNVYDSSLEKVNDVRLVQSFFGRIFGYGDVEILTASDVGINLFKRIGDPVHFKTVMINAKQDLDRMQSGVGIVHEAAPDIPAMIAKLDELRQKGIITEAEFQQKKAELLAKL
jgi:hypothetical protein